MNTFSSLFELLSIVILWSTFKYNQKHRIIKVLITSLITLLILKLTNSFNPVAIIFINYFVLLISVVLIFNTQFFLAFVSLTFCHVLVVFYEFILVLLCNTVFADFNILAKYDFLILSFFMFIVMFFVHRSRVWKNIVSNISDYIGRLSINPKYLWILNALGYCCIIVVLWDSYPKFFVRNKAFLFSIFTLVMFVNYYMYRSDIALRENEAMQQYYKKYYPQLINIVEDIRAKQHEYKNHLNTIYGIIEVSKTNLRSDLKKYVDTVSVDLDDVMIIKIDNVVINAIIYSKLVEAKSLNIKFTYQVENLNSLPLADYELTEVLSNLINNAFDAVAGQESPAVYLEMYKDELHKLHIIVSNNAQNIKSQELTTLVNRGYSSKKKNRGYGLYNIKKIINSNNGTLSMTAEKNKTIFEVEIPNNDN